MIAAFAVAIVPYHVFISRQVLLDVPAGLAVLLAFAALYRYEGYETRRLLYLAGALAGIACVTKETMIIFGPAALLYLAWAGLLKKTRFRDGVIALVLMLVPLLPFISTRFFFSGSSSSGYIVYQLFREPNHPFWYFPVVFWIFITPVATLAIAYGVFIAAARRTRGDKLLLSWLIVFGAFFQFWPTKLLPYAIILVPAMALLGSRGVVDAVRRIRARWSVGLTTAVAAVVALAVFVPMLGPTWRAGDVIRDSSFSGPLTTDVEVQDFAGGREVGTWFAKHTPTNATVLTMGPSLGNLVSFYGDRDFYALSVSRDEKLRNPAYRPILNPDSEIRQMHVQYAVWDAYTADRSPFYSQQLMAYQEKYSGTPVFSVWVDGNDVSTTPGAAPPGAELRIVVYALVGGDPLRDLTTSLSRSSITAGEEVHDSATLSGATSDARGTVDYSVYTDTACTILADVGLGAQVGNAGTKTVTNGTIPDSNDVTFSQAGTYYFQAVYSGDSKNGPAQSTCASDTLRVAPATTTSSIPTGTVP